MPGQLCKSLSRHKEITMNTKPEPPTLSMLLSRQADVIERIGKAVDKIVLATSTLTGGFAMPVVKNPESEPKSHMEILDVHLDQLVALSHQIEISGERLASCI